METIKSLVLLILPFLTEAKDGATIDMYIKNYQTLLQECLGKTDLQVYDDAAYTYAEKSFIADIVCIAMLNQKAIEYATQVDANGAPVFSKFLKRAKAGTVEAEFAMVGDEGGGLKISFAEMMKFFLNSAYAKAAKYPCSLHFLGPIMYDGEVPFNVEPWIC